MKRGIKISTKQFEDFKNANYLGKEIFNMMIDFYKKFDNGVAAMLIEEDEQIVKATKRHYMYSVLSSCRSMWLSKPVYLKWETLNDEHYVYLSRPYADSNIHYYMCCCKADGCGFPENIGISDALDYLNKWFCHYNEV